MTDSQKPVRSVVAEVRNSVAADRDRGVLRTLTPDEARAVYAEARERP